MNKSKEPEAARIIRELVNAGFTSEAKKKALAEAEAAGVDSETMYMIENVVPMD